MRPVIGDRAFGYSVNVTNQSLELIRCSRREGGKHQIPQVQISRCRRSGNGATPKKDTPWTVMSNGALCRLQRTFIVAE